MNEAQLRTQLEKKLDRPIEGDLWRYLVEERYVEEALSSEYDNSFESLVEAARKQLKLARQLANRKSPPGRKAHVVAPPSLQAQEWDRAQALAGWLGHHVTALPRIRRLREKFFEGVLLSADQAKGLLNSPALRFLSWYQYTALGIPLVGHEARVVNTVDDWPSTPRTIAVTLQIVWAAGTYEGTFYWEEVHHGRGTRPKEIQLPPCVEDWRVDVWQDSVLNELHECRFWLARRYPWSDNDALWFVLTGEYPKFSPLELRHDVKESRDLYRHRIMLTVDPWVSAQTVARAYRAVQDLVLAGRDNRPLRARNLALVRFIAARRDAHGKRPRWKDLLEEWNQTCHPEWTYDRISTFAKAVDRAEMTLRFPPYRGTQGPGDKTPLPDAQVEGGDRIPLAEEAPFFWQRQEESAG